MINMLFGCTLFAWVFNLLNSTIKEDFLGQATSNFMLLFLILRLFVLFIIFISKLFFPNVHMFLHKFANDKDYAISVFKICLWIDLPILIIVLLFLSFAFLLNFISEPSLPKYILAIITTTFSVQFIFPGGITVLYAAFWLEYKLIKSIINYDFEI